MNKSYFREVWLGSAVSLGVENTTKRDSLSVFKFFSKNHSIWRNNLNLSFKIFYEKCSVNMCIRKKKYKTLKTFYLLVKVVCFLVVLALPSSGSGYNDTTIQFLIWDANVRVTITIVRHWNVIKKKKCKHNPQYTCKY